MKIWNVRHIIKIWFVVLIVMTIVFLIFSFDSALTISERIFTNKLYLLWLVLLSFLAEVVDSSIGMGFGLILGPILLLGGYSSINILGAILISEFFTGVFAGLFHHRKGNVDFSKGSQARTVVIIIVVSSLVGILFGILLVDRISQFILRIFFGLLLLSIGLFIIAGWKILGTFNNNKMKLLGIIAAFNKGISGGGYGPILTGGQVILDVPVKSAVGITSLSEGIVSFISAAAYCLIYSFPPLSMTAPMIIGGLMAVPFAVVTVKHISKELLRQCIGWAMLILGFLTLIRFIFII